MDRRTTIRGGRGARACALASALSAVVVLLAPLPASAGTPIITSPVSGAIAPAADFLRIKGTADPSSSVDVFKTGEASPLGTTTTNGAGRWSLQTSVPSGTYSVSAVASNPDGSTAPSSPVTFQADALRPFLTTAEPDANTIFDLGEQPAVDGTASDENGVIAVQVEYWVLDERVMVQNAACADCGSGAQSVTWRDEPELSVGYYYVRVHAIDSAGNRSQTGNTSFFTSGMEPAPELPEVPGAPAVEVPTIEVPLPGNDQPGANGPITIGGTGPAGLDVRVEEMVDNVRMGRVQTTAGDGQTGWWHITAQLTDGEYGIRVRGFDETGRRSKWSAVVWFYVDGLRPEVGLENGTQIFGPTQPVQLSGVVTDNRQVLGVALEYWLANRMVLQQLAECPQCASGNATWWHSPALQLPGYYYVRVYAVDAAGNKGHYETIDFVKAGV